MTRRVIDYDGQMRWAPDARGRLERAAFDLFGEQGYAATTVPQITARAGLTTRTFFRYFADKREVIFGGDEIPRAAARLISEAPPELEPIDVIRLVLDEVAATRFDGRREETAAWRRMINADDSLRDRDARKRADLVAAARTAFVDRGEAQRSATIFAETGALIFHVALDAWLAEPEARPMGDTIAEIMTWVCVRRLEGTPLGS
ncbi:TetR family transcriptional regulator [Lapillicoccus sp.]|uniref:TetR family transcriptional regulator n=1 Tax=Lapillicoccus sp. TaxID=1909287 RepID=UPI002600D404|nr:TetR family transcriptional regulator [Lapillicoccus sp.]